MPNSQAKTFFCLFLDIATKSAVKMPNYQAKTCVLVPLEWPAGTLLGLEWPTGRNGCRTLSLLLGSCRRQP